MNIIHVYKISPTATFVDRKVKGQGQGHWKGEKHIFGHNFVNNWHIDMGPTPFFSLTKALSNEWRSSWRKIDVNTSKWRHKMTYFFDFWFYWFFLFICIGYGSRLSLTIFELNRTDGYDVIDVWKWRFCTFSSFWSKYKILNGSISHYLDIWSF